MGLPVEARFTEVVEEAMMRNYQLLAVYCSKINCGTNERHGDEPRDSRHIIAMRFSSLQRMKFVGSKKIGFFKRLFRRGPGTDYYFRCPVCGNEETYFEEEKVTKTLPAPVETL
jgi:hypothetical protein